jgi:cell division transport system permease protein
MRNWVSQHRRTLAGTVARMAHTPFASLLNIGVIGIALALPTGFYVGLANVQALARDLAAEPQLSIFLALEANRADAAEIEERLKAHQSVRQWRFVSRDEALADLKSATGLGDIVGSLGHNPLPDAFVIDASDSSPQALERVRDEIQGWPKVARVQHDAAWANRLDAALRLGRAAVLLLATLLAFALIAITFNTIRLQILTQRQEIEVSKLIGATDPFIRRPFLYYGGVLGLAGGLAAWAIVWAAIGLLNQGLADLAQQYGARFELRHLAVTDSLSLLGFAAWLGWFGARLSVGRHLAEIDPR